MFASSPLKLISKLKVSNELKSSILPQCREADSVLGLTYHLFCLMFVKLEIVTHHPLNLDKSAWVDLSGTSLSRLLSLQIRDGLHYSKLTFSLSRIRRLGGLMSLEEFHIWFWCYNLARRSDGEAARRFWGSYSTL